MLYLHFICVFSMFISGRMNINNLLYARIILMIFFNVFISMKEGLGGVTNAWDKYLWEHIAFLTEPIDGCCPNLVGMK